ncbi:uncharacterized protein LOC110725370 [Chenopodium quinoa]|uniref:uncharacterized protein LOC110725370 n=1 Tax=Chenopodium quinoa TaxID=63459 RepID=UPI000B791FB8|nr:uncharacterized protein LOC110725370 [Chenopodium quinoa]
MNSMSLHHIDVTVKKGLGSTAWRLTGFYGWPEVHNRHLSWKLLNDLYTGGIREWVCLGDFNEILADSEKKGGRDRALWQMQHFREVVDLCNLQDIPFTGYEFTFDNGQFGDDNVQCRLDRALALQEWLDVFPNAKLVHLEREWSDHAPIKLLLGLDGQSNAKGKRLFRFEHIWTESEKCEEVVEQGWLYGGDSVGNKLGLCAELLSSWSDKEYEQIFREICRKRKWLSALNRGSRSEARVKERRKVVKDIAELLHFEEMYWRQRPRALWFEDHEGVSNVAVSYFKNLFTSSNPVNYEDALDGIERRVSVRMNDTLLADFSADEVFIALKQMHPLKAPGPDGPAVTNLVIGVLKGNAIPDTINKTFIVVVYKLITKVLANRLKSFLSDITSINQSAFTTGRLITDNILVAFEVFHHMKNSMSDSGHLALTLDMAKAYDRVEWGFLRVVMSRFGFADVWVDRALSGLLRRAVEQGSLHGIKIATTTPPISHLLFADDNIIFSRANVDEVEKIKNVLKVYEEASGQMVNLGKTTVSFSKGVPEDRKGALADALGVNVVDIHDKYLGLPTVIGRSKRVLTKGIREKLCKRLQGWKGGILSKAGREVLIKAVAQSIPTYAMSVFKFPSSFCDELRSLVANFWWGQRNGERKIHWIAWKRLCEPKAAGGLGFRDFKLFNEALLGKQAWRLIQFPDSLVAKVLKAKYYPNGDFMSSELGATPSYSWRGIWGSKWVINRGARWRVGDGLDILVWKSPWIPGTSSRKVVSPRGEASEDMRVCDLLQLAAAQWNVPLIDKLFLPFERDRILSIPVSFRLPRDRMCWDLERDGVYSVRSAYRAIFGDVGVEGVASSSSPTSIWKKVWHASTLPRVKIFFWRACLGALPTAKGLHRRVPRISPLCSICGVEEETEMHCLRDCFIARSIWEKCELDWRGGGAAQSFGEVALSRLDGLPSKEHGWFITICWVVWTARNRWAFEREACNAKGSIEYVTKLMKDLQGEEAVSVRGGKASKQ